MKSCLFLYLIMCVTFSFAQVGIGTTTPSPAAMLDINGGENGNYRGMLPPRVPNDAARNSINPSASDAGLMVFVESTGCLDLWNGAAWASVNCLGGSSIVWINEFHYDNASTDVGEFIEIAGVAGTDLSEYYFINYNGENGSPYGSITQLSGIIDNESMGYGAVFFTSIGDLQNGVGGQNSMGDGFILMGPNNTIVQFLSYEGEITPTVGPANGVTSEDVGVAEINTTPVGNSLQLIGTGNSYSDFSWNTPAAESPGSLNTSQIIMN